MNLASTISLFLLSATAKSSAEQIHYYNLINSPPQPECKVTCQSPKQKSQPRWLDSQGTRAESLSFNGDGNTMAAFTLGKNSDDTTETGKFAAPENRFRIMSLRADRSLKLVKLLSTRHGAIELAHKLVDAHLLKLRLRRAEVLQNPSRPREVYVERWIGSTIEGHWELLPLNEGGFRFVFHDQRPRHARNIVANDAIAKSADRANAGSNGSVQSNNQQHRLEPISGDLVQVELLARRTRKGGWFAKLVDLPAS